MSLSLSKAGKGAGAVSSSPVNTTPPYISGSGIVKSDIICNPGAWVGALSFTYQWYSNGIPTGYNSNTYTPSPYDSGKTISVVVYGNNAHGSTPAAGSNTIEIQRPIAGSGSNILQAGSGNDSYLAGGI